MHMRENTSRFQNRNVLQLAMLKLVVPAELLVDDMCARAAQGILGMGLIVHVSKTKKIGTQNKARR